MAFCLDLAPDHLRKILGSSIHTSPCLFSYDNKFCTVESSIAFCIMQLAGTVSIRAHLDADVKSSKLVGAALQLIHRSVREAASRCRVRYAGLVANLTLVRVTQHQGCMIQIVWCVAPFRQEALEGDTLQLTTQLFPALCALCPNRLQPDLLGVFAVSQLSHLPVPPCCALVDWPVGTPFTVYAYNDLLAVRAAHPPVTVGWPSWHLQPIGMTYLALFWLLVAGLCPC